MGPIQASANSTAQSKAGDVWGSSSFMGGDFIVNGNKNDIGAMLLQYWPFIVAAGVVWYVKFRK